MPSSSSSSSNKKPPPSPFFRPHESSSSATASTSATTTPTSTTTSVVVVVKEAKSTLLGCTANLMNAIVGAGIVSIPYAVQQSGLVLGLCLVGLCAVLTDKSLRLLLATAKHAHCATYETVAEAAFGKAGFWFVAASMFVMAYGAVLSYLMIIKDSFSALLGVTDAPRRRAVLWIVAVTVLLPLSCQRDVANLAWTSRLSVGLDAVLVACVAYNAVYVSDRIDDTEASSSSSSSVLQQQQQQLDHNWRHDNDSYTLLFRDSRYWIRPETVFVGLGVLSFAFVCQHSAFLIAGSLERPTIRRWSVVTHTALTACALLAWASGLAGYLGFALQNNGTDDDTDDHPLPGNILNSLDATEWTANLARTLLGCTMLTVYPLESFVARHVLVSLLFQGRRAHEGNDEADLLNRSDRRVGLTAVIFVLAMVPASVTDNLGHVLAVTGAVGGSCLSYIGPGMVYLGIHGERFLQLVQRCGSVGSEARLWCQRNGVESSSTTSESDPQINASGQATTQAVETTPLVQKSVTSKTALTKTATDDSDNSTDKQNCCCCELPQWFQRFLWYAWGMPLWCYIAARGQRTLDRHMYQAALRSPHPLRIGDVEWKAPHHFHKNKQIKDHNVPDKTTSEFFLPLSRENSLPLPSHDDTRPSTLLLSRENSLPTASINQQIGKQLLAQKHRHPNNKLPDNLSQQPVEPDTQEHPTWYDFGVAIFYCIFGVIALVAGLLSLAVEEAE